MNHHLQETTFMKEAYKKYIKDDMKSIKESDTTERLNWTDWIKGKLEEQRPERVKHFIWQELQSKSSTSLLTSKPISSWDLPVVQWLRIHLPMQGSWVQSLLQEDPTCHNYSVGAQDPANCNYQSQSTYSPCSATREATAANTQHIT